MLILLNEHFTRHKMSKINKLAMELWEENE